ncbi:MAG TPA: HU family DNA-binding protein [Bryobacteraceae bacterium]|nr:HU family DNA-binding protein [Bryobacteraceae bacterium]
MKKPELATRLAEHSGVSQAEAADQLDRVVNRIIANLKKGEAAQLPGLGKFVPGPTWNFQFDHPRAKGSARRAKR